MLKKSLHFCIWFIKWYLIIIIVIGAIGMIVEMIYPEALNSTDERTYTESANSKQQVEPQKDIALEKEEHKEPKPEPAMKKEEEIVYSKDKLANEIIIRYNEQNCSTYKY